MTAPRGAIGGWGNPRIQGRILAAALVASGALGAVLGVRYWGSVVEHRKTAEQAVRMRAGLIAMQFATAVQAQLYTAVESQLAPAGDPMDREVPGRLAAIEDSLALCNCGPRLYGDLFLRYEPRAGRLDAAGATRTAAQRDARREAMHAILTARSQTLNDRFGITGSDDGTPWLLFMRRVVRGSDTVGLAIEVRLDSLRRQWDWLVTGLRVPGTEAESASAAITVELQFADSTVVYRRGPAREGLAASSDPSWAPLRTRVIVDPAAAGRFVPGGLPRLPVQSLVLLSIAGGSIILLGLLFNARAQALAAARAEFTAGVSHELRTPLTQILLFAETLLLERAESPDDRRSAAQAIVRESRRLIHMIENVLQFATSERSAVSLAPRVQPLSPLINDIVRLAGPLAAAEGSRLELIWRATPAAAVDDAALRQILGNLLDNAIRHGPTGQTVRVIVEAVDGEARIRVEDEGSGVPAADRGRIFDPYVRLVTAPRRATGAGLGLSVVRHLTGLLDGRVWVEDAAAGGAAFVVALPLAAEAGVSE